MVIIVVLSLSFYGDVGCYCCHTVVISGEGEVRGEKRGDRARKWK